MNWRFLGEERQRVAWSVYPQLELNIRHSSVAKGLVAAGRPFVLPAEITVAAGPFEVTARSDGTSWTTAMRGARRAPGGGARRADPQRRVRQGITRQVILMPAVGRAMRGVPAERPRRLLFAGLQLNLPAFYNFDRPEGR